jgi:hypothetical protein
VFRLCDSFLGAVFGKLCTKRAPIFGILFPMVKVIYRVWQKGQGQYHGRFFSQTHLVAQQSKLFPILSLIWQAYNHFLQSFAQSRQKERPAKITTCPELQFRVFKPRGLVLVHKLKQIFSLAFISLKYTQWQRELSYREQHVPQGWILSSGGEVNPWGEIFFAPQFL